MSKTKQKTNNSIHNPRTIAILNFITELQNSDDFMKAIEHYNEYKRGMFIGKFAENYYNMLIIDQDINTSKKQAWEVTKKYVDALPDEPILEGIKAKHVIKLKSQFIKI